MLHCPNNASVTLKLKKCALFINKRDYVGHVMNLEKLELASNATDESHNLQVLTAVIKLRPFVVLCTSFKPFLPK